MKSPAEIRLLRRAAELTDLAMATIRDTLADGRPHTERELARLADAAMIAAGADRTAYDSMVQAGPRSAYNLARPTDRVLRPGDLVMTDIGARYRGYVADGGRGFTYGPASAEKRAIVEAAAAAVEAGLAAARPGMLATELNAVIQQALVESGYERYSGEARGHGTGHGTGMDPEEESPWIGPGNRTRLCGDGLHAQGDDHRARCGRSPDRADRPPGRDGRGPPRHVSDASLLVDTARLAIPSDARRRHERPHTTRARASARNTTTPTSTATGRTTRPIPTTPRCRTSSSGSRRWSPSSRRRAWSIRPPSTC